MNNKNFVKFLSYLGFLGTWYVSFLLNCTLATTKIDYIVAFIFTTVMQYASFYFFVKRKENSKYIIFASVLFAVSILGTMSYQMSIHNLATNESVKNSTEFKNHNQVIKDKENQVQNYENDKLEIDEQYVSQIVSVEEIRDNRPENHYTRKENDNKKIQELMNESINKKSEIDDKIFKLNEEISKLKTQTVTTEIKETKGYLGISVTLADWLDWKVDTVTLLIQFLIAVTFESTAIMLHMSVEDNKIIGVMKNETKKENVKTKEIMDNLDDIIHNDKPDNALDRHCDTLGLPHVTDLVKKKTSEVKVNLAKIDDIEIKKYRNMMEQTATNHICIGYARISKLAGLTTSKGRQIFEHLKQIGIIETTDKGTVILKYQKKGKVV